jgi:hypothetical protein
LAEKVLNRLVLTHRLIRMIRSDGLTFSLSRYICTIQNERPGSVDKHRVAFTLMGRPPLIQGRSEFGGVALQANSIEGYANRVLVGPTDFGKEEAATKR